MNQLNLKNYMELCRRLGIRYVSMGAPRTAPASAMPVENETVPEPKAAMVSSAPEEGKTLEGSKTSTSGIPNWLTGSPDTEKARRLMALDASICQCQKCPSGKNRNPLV